MSIFLFICFCSTFISVSLFWIWAAKSLNYYVREHKSLFEESVKKRLQDAFLFVDAKRLFFLHSGIVIFSVCVLWIISSSFILVVLVAVLEGALPSIFLNIFRKKRLEHFRNQIPDLLLLLSGSLRAGMSLYQGVAQAAREMSSPMRQELELLLREQRLGISIEEGFSSLIKRIPSEELTLLVSALSISSKTGGNLSDALDLMASSIRRTIAVEGKIKALTAQGKLQAIVMSALPAFLGGVMFIIDYDAMLPLIKTWYGLCLCASVLVLQIIGAYIIFKIVAIDI